MVCLFLMHCILTSQIHLIQQLRPRTYHFLNLYMNTNWRFSALYLDLSLIILKLSPQAFEVFVVISSCAVLKFDKS